MLHAVSAPGSAVLVEDQLLAASATTFDFLNIPGGFKHLVLVGNFRTNSGTNSRAILLRFNNDSGTNYDYQYLQVNNTTVTGSLSTAQTSMSWALAAGADATANMYGASHIVIADYANSARHKEMSFSGTVLSSAAAQAYTRVGGGQWRSTSAITRITLLEGTVDFAAGCRASLYALS